jgi:hypothetical protein
MSEEHQLLFLYWIEERWNIYCQKQGGYGKPWSKDSVFQQTYFCNVHRENDRVTKWIRENWTIEQVGSINYEFWMILARFLNWPDTLELVCSSIVEDLDREDGQFTSLQKDMEDLAELGSKVWGNAYVITSHGMPIPKATYLCQHLLPDAYRALPALKAAGAVGTCGAVAGALQRITGIGSFLAGQVVADLKNTKGHPLYDAPDKKDFVVPGPGSIRGLNWWHVGSEKGPVNERNFSRYFLVQGPRVQVDEVLKESIPYIDNQDLQNCLCEFDKYCRVKFGMGRSKRKYHGL